MNPESGFLIGHIVCISQWCAFIMVDYAYLGKGRVRPLWLWTTVLVAGELFLGIKLNIGFFTLLSIWENVGFVLVSTLLFGGTLADMPVAAVAGLLESLVCQYFGRHGINRMFTDIAAAFCCTVWAIAVQAVLPAVSANAAIIGALMVLTPGVALTMGVRDILNGDYLSGSIRLLDALFIAGSIAGGVVLGWILARGLGVAV